MISELCAKLKDKRHALKITVEEAVERTKLYPTVIRDIEAADFSNINSAYLKGYFRIYAAFLGVELGHDLDDVLDQMHKKSSVPPRRIIVALPEKEKPAASPDSFAQTGFKKAGVIFRKVSDIPAHVKQVILIIVAVIIGLWLIVGALRFVGQAVSGFLKARQQQSRVTALAEKKTSQEPKVDQEGNEIIPLERTSSKNIAVSLTVRKNCFIRVRVSGKVIFEGVLKAGTVETWKGQDKIELKISDGSAVYLEVNGKAIPRLSSLHKPIKNLEITSMGIVVEK